MSDPVDSSPAGVLRRLIEGRHSERAPYDPSRPVPEEHLQKILEAARWAPTPHNMQNFEVVVVDDKAQLEEVGRVRSELSMEFVRENYQQLSFSEEELIEKGTGLLAAVFPPSWQKPDARPEDVADFEHGFLDSTMRSCPAVMVVLYDPRTRAPASEGDFLGIMSLGCVMQNMWLMAEALGVGMQVMSVFSSSEVEDRLRGILGIPAELKIAFACRLGYPSVQPRRYLRVRRPVARFSHRNSFGVSPAG